MPKTIPRFTVGDKVHVCSGILDPDFDDLTIGVLSLLDPDDFPGEEYGVFCQVRRDRKRIELPLTEVEIDKANPNRRLVDDHSYWLSTGETV